MEKITLTPSAPYWWECPGCGFKNEEASLGESVVACDKCNQKFSLDESGDESTKIKKPTLVENLKLGNLKETCQAYLDNPEPDGDFEHYIFEEAMQAFFGRDVFDYINGRLK